MIVGVGMDIIDIDRIAQAYEKNNQFVNRILTGVELDMFNQLENRRQMEFLAGRFAAKEAYSKAVGTGIGKMRFTDMEVGKASAVSPFGRGRCHRNVGCISLLRTRSLSPQLK